jgi:hypothetical protein
MASHGGLDDGVVDLEAIEQPPVRPCRRRQLSASPTCREQVLSGADRKGNPRRRHLHRRAPIDAVHIFLPLPVSINAARNRRA